MCQKDYVLFISVINDLYVFFIVRECYNTCTKLNGETFYRFMQIIL